MVGTVQLIKFRYLLIIAQHLLARSKIVWRYTDQSTRDGFSYFRSGGWINIWGGGGAAAGFGRGVVATPGKAKEKG